MADTRMPRPQAQLAYRKGASLFPEPPLLMAGAIGGPLIIGSLTPLRNACTLAAQDTHSTVRQIFGKVFSSGTRSGWTGACTPAAAAAVQFTMLGPGYFFYLGALGSPAAATAAGAVTESLITYGPTTRNSQLMHNQVAASAGKVPVKPLMPVGPGFGMLVLRNGCANAGIRVLSDPLARSLTHLTSNKDALGPGTGHVPVSPACKMGGDFLASVVCGAISMPFNQLFNFHVTTPASLNGGNMDRFTLGLKFLKSQYVESSESGWSRPTRMVLRDTFLRSLYIGCMFSSYAAVERLSLSLWRASDLHR